jgi:DNA-binding XRE family transcriptional regulator
MRMADRVAELQRNRAIAKPGELAVVRRARSQAYRERVAQKIAEARAKLTPEDQILAGTLRLPKKRVERVQMAKELRQAESGRKRSRTEVAAMMGVTYTAVKGYEDHPDKLPPNPHSEPPKLPPKIVREEPKAEPQVAFGRALHRRRKRSAVTQATLAQKAGVAKERIAAIEYGEVPTVEESVALTTALDKLC